ncbi:50S ribosomal protein L29 [Patescibacteria group bacterium]|nr:50S ribosomal protein L29 [Patescibacteria group bacterium]MBU1895782.1 50S ribosomal protein L29 [Patescibacteria group bacterium]
MKFVDLKRQSRNELEKLLVEKRGELREHRFKVGEGQLKNVSSIKKIRQVIARILTIFNTKITEDTKESTEEVN